MSQENARLIAMALYEIRLLLTSYLGSESEAATDVRAAAHLAYALHNEAAALAEGNDFDVEEALRRVEAIERIVSGASFSGLVAQCRAETK